MRVSNNKNRLENKQSAYNIGMTSITEQDWEELMNNIDSCMESVKKIREEEKENNEESLESKIYNRIYMKLHSSGEKEN